MPYIKQVQRDTFESALQNLYFNMPEQLTTGELNYLLTQIVFFYLED